MSSGDNNELTMDNLRHNLKHGCRDVERSLVEAKDLSLLES